MGIFVYIVQLLEHLESWITKRKLIAKPNCLAKPQPTILNFHTYIYSYTFDYCSKSCLLCSVLCPCITTAIMPWHIFYFICQDAVLLFLTYYAHEKTCTSFCSYQLAKLYSSYSSYAWLDCIQSNQLTSYIAVIIRLF